MISSISCTMFGLMLAGSSREISRGSPIASYCCWSPLIEPADCWSRCCKWESTLQQRTAIIFGRMPLIWQVGLLVIA